MDKFSELIAQGVANFEYKPITQTTPSNCLEDPDYEMIRMYNNLYSIATNTHMSRTEDGDIVITGTLVRDKKYFVKFLYSNWYKNLTFQQSLLEFLRCYGYTGCYDILNSDHVYKLKHLAELNNNICVGDNCCVCQMESQIPQNIKYISKTANIESVRECLKNENVVEALNEHQDIKGNNWMIAGLSDGYHLMELDNKLIIK